MKNVSYMSFGMNNKDMILASKIISKLSFHANLEQLLYFKTELDKIVNVRMTN